MFAIRSAMPSPELSPTGYRPKRSLSPAAVGGVVIVHVGLATAILTMSNIPLPHNPLPIIFTRNIPVDPPKPIADPPRSDPKPHARVTAPDPIIDAAKSSDAHGMPLLPPLDGDPDDGGKVIPIAIDPVVPDPVLVGPKPDARYAGAFQPAYPPAMLRMQKEGDVVVRVLIDADGRVRDVILVSAADPAFFDAARRQALKAWRFLPATRDGTAVASEKVMTVHFKLTD